MYMLISKKTVKQQKGGKRKNVPEYWILRLLLSLLVKKNLQSVNIWQNYKQYRGCLMHFLRLLAVCWLGEQSARDNHALACNFAKYLPIPIFFH